MPELVSLFNGVGGLASLAVAYAAIVNDASASVFVLIVSFLALLIGAVTFSGSIVAWAKLSERIVGRPIVFKGQAIANVVLLLAIAASGYLLVTEPAITTWHYVAIGLALLMGVMLVLPIGGADMPVENNLLIVAGALVGASGIILTNIMCKAMNRSLVNVLTSGFQKVHTNEMKIEGEIKPLSPDDAFYVLEAAQSVLVIPGYGMAVAQAQHTRRMCRMSSCLRWTRLTHE